MSDLMKGKRGLVMGVANERSIAWGIARAMAAEGAQVLDLAVFMRRHRWFGVPVSASMYRGVVAHEVAHAAVAMLARSVQRRGAPRSFGETSPGSRKWPRRLRCL